MTKLLAPLSLVRGRVRRQPGQWLWPLIGLTIAIGFAGAVAAEAVVSEDQAATAILRTLSPVDRSVRVTWQGPSTASSSARAAQILDGLGLGSQTEVTLLGPVRLTGVVVRPAAIAPVDRWLSSGVAARLGPCRATGCRVLATGDGQIPSLLRTTGVRIEVVGRATLRSDVPLTTAPAQGQPPLLITGDPAGLDAIAGLAGVYRTHTRLGEVSTGQLHSWDLARLQGRLAGAQAELQAGEGQFSMSAPFDGLAAARTEAGAAHRSLLLAGGGALAAMALFVVLAAAGLRREQLLDLERLRAAGASPVQLAVLVAGEALALSGLALVVGFAVAVAAAVVVAAGAGEPIGPVLTHSVLSPAAGLALAAGWIVAGCLIALAAQVRTRRLLDAAALVAAAALATGLTLGGRHTGTWAALLPPLCCLAAGVVVFGLTAWLLGPAERLVRRGPASVRLALIGLARTPGLPALATAFVCVSVALGGFALVYRATLQRGAADQAADRVPLDAIVWPGPSFATPTQLAPLPGWRALGGAVFPVRRTEASYLAGSGTTTIPALGVPAAALTHIHGWRASDGSAPLGDLARRLVPPGAARQPGPRIPAGADQISLAAYSPQLAVGVTADLTDPNGGVQRLALGTADSSGSVLRARVPAGSWRVEALELTEGRGLEATDAHQNGESQAPSTQFTASLELGAMRIARHGTRGEAVPLGSWVTAGAVSRIRGSAAGVAIHFQTTGQPGIVRPAQPTDRMPVPVLVDRATAAAAGPGGLLGLVVDDQPLRARVVGVLQRFPTLSGAGGFVVADESMLATALDGQLPGQGRPDELWIDAPRAGALRAALDQGRLSQLNSAFRPDIEQAIRDAPATRGLTGTLVAAAAVCGLLGLIGLLLVAQGPLRDRRLVEDLAAQGLGPAGLRRELRTRLVLTGLLGVAPGIAIALLLETLAVTAVGSGTGQPAVPPLVGVTPVVGLVAWAIGAGLLVAVAAWAAAWRLVPSAARARAAPARPPGRGDETLREGWAR